MYNSDMDYGRNSQDDGFTDDFTDDFSDGFTAPSDDNFFNDDNFDNQADTPRTSGTRFKRASVSPEPINLSNGKTFTIKALNNSSTNIFVKSCRLNGQPLTRPYITYKEIMDGGLLELEMTNKI